MNNETEEIDTSETPKCPKCGYITFIGQDTEDDERYCMECSTVWKESECEL